MKAILLRLIFSALAGLIIGSIFKHRDTSRVFALICVGAALVAIISTESFKFIELPWHSDPGRISAQVLAALGFLGAGFIWISDKQEVKGLSLSAALWYTAILGMLIGGGFPPVVIAVAIFAFALYGIGHLVISKWR